MEQKQQDLRQQIETVLQEIRQSLALHGGGVDLVTADESTGKVVVRLSGACDGCPYAGETLHGLVEALLVDRVPGVKSVEAEEQSL